MPSAEVPHVEERQGLVALVPLRETNGTKKDRRNMQNHPESTSQTFGYTHSSLKDLEGMDPIAVTIETV